MSRSRRRGAARRRRARARARCSTSRACARRRRPRRSEIGEALERFAHNTIEHMREERELLAGQDRAAPLRHRLSRSLHARRGPRRRPSARSARAAAVHPRHAPGDRRGRRRRRGPARGGPHARHDRRGHGLGRRGGPALRRRARRALLSGRTRARSPPPGGAGPELQAGSGARHEPGCGAADRRGEGRPTDRLGGLAVQPRRVPRPQPQRHVLDVPHAPAHRRDPRRCQGREPPLPAPARPHAAAGGDRGRPARACSRSSG